MAGFAAGMGRGYTYSQMIKYAFAMGASNAAEKETGKISLQYVEKLLSEIEIETFIQLNEEKIQ
ncbi:hypothetical protein [Mesobacillus zeae]|uniref:hypothetical protein n=1 Tax=Mesobacillus zeae TaxID=1917180 RepID=UPI0035BE4478